MGIFEKSFNSLGDFGERLGLSAKGALDNNRARQQQAAFARQQAAQNQQAQQIQALLATNTGMGACPQCGSHSMSQIVEKEKDDNSAANAAACLGCLFFWPLILASFFLKRKGQVTTFRQCNSCGYKYRI